MIERDSDKYGTFNSKVMSSIVDAPPSQDVCVCVCVR